MSGNLAIYIILVILFLIIVVNIALVVILYSKIANIRRNQVVLNRKFSGETVEELLFKTFERQAELGKDVAKFKNEVLSLQNQQNKNFDKLKVVRYDATNETDAKLSFSVGLTNENEDGLVITGLHFRNGVNLYVKNIKEGIPDMELSDEEKKVISRNNRKVNEND